MTDNTHYTDIQAIENPIVSVIVPAYNAEKYLAKCLDSIFNQTYKDFEVIVVNDGSTDGTREICERYANTNSNMTVHNQRNGGIANARNEGLKLCKGKFIAFSDSDDYVEPEWLQHSIEVMNRDPKCDLVVEGIMVDNQNKCNQVMINNNKYEDNKIIDVYILLKEHNIEGFLVNKLYKKKIIEDNNISFKYKLKEDLLFNLKYLCNAASVITLSATDYHYVQHGSQSLIHKRYPANYMKKIITSLYLAALNLCEKYQANELRRNIIEEYLLSYAVLLFSMYQKTNGIADKAERIKYIKEYQQRRKDYHNIKITTGSIAKRGFAKLMMLPPTVADTIMCVTYNH